MVALFVFGTLKQHFPNFQINSGRRLAGRFVTEQRYPLYLVGDRYAPWLILDQGHGFNVYGEVFMVDDATLQSMDKLERANQKNGYQRVEIMVRSEDSSQQLQVFVYGKSSAQLDPAQIKSAVLAEYTLEHSRLYRRRQA